MTYVDLNPIRAQICDSIDDSLHTSARARLDTIEKDRTRADQPLAPVLGVPGLCVLAMSQRDYLDLVDHTGRRIIPASAAPSLGHRPPRLRAWVTALSAGSDRFWPWAPGTSGPSARPTS